MKADKINSENRWVIVFALVVMVLLSVPYFVGYQQAADEWVFTGFLFGVTDGNSYLAKMLSGAAGEWLFRTPYSAVHQDGALIFFPYLLLGKLSAQPGQHPQLVAIYHIFRFAGGVLAIIATYDFMALFLRQVHSRRLGVFLATLGGGGGWILVLLGRSQWLGFLPLDFFSPETFGFLGIFGIAHLPWARAFFLWGLRAFLIRVYDSDPLNVPILGIANWPPGLLWVLTLIFQQLTGMLIGVLVGWYLVIFLAINGIRRYLGHAWAGPYWKKLIQTAFWAGLITLPLVGYSFWVYFQDPFINQWMAQNRLPAPPIPHYLVAYGFLLPFVVIALVKKIRQLDLKKMELFLFTWFFLIPLLFMMPFNLQRRLIEGFWIVLVILALSLFDFTPKRGIQWIRVYSLFTIPSTLILWIGSFTAAQNPTIPVFRPTAEVAAFNFLARTTTANDVVLSSFETGNALPAWIPVYVVLGHGPETINHAQIATRVSAFYTLESSDQVRRSLLDDYNVDYVFWGPEERELGSWQPGEADYLFEIFSDGEYSIFSVIK